MGRNTLTGPELRDWDLRLTRDIAIKERAHLRLIFEGFDITNRANFAGIQGNQYTYRTFVFTPTTNFLTKLTMQPAGTGSRVVATGRQDHVLATHQGFSLRRCANHALASPLSLTAAALSEPRA